MFNAFELFFLWYFIAVNGVYALLLCLGMVRVYFRKKEINAEDYSTLLHSNSMPDICFIIPMHNEKATIIDLFKNIFHLSYRYKQIIAINDDSTDGTLELIQKEMELIKIPKFYEDRLQTGKIRAVYRSKSHPELILIDKEHSGGKFDAVNAGLNACKHPFFIVADADSFIDDVHFSSLVRPILSSPEQVGIGAGIRMKSGCTLEFNRISAKDFPGKFIAAFQVLEYMRSFLMRQGWNYAGGNFVIAGAFSIFRTDLIVDIGGFCASVAEDMEIVVRLHRVMKEAKLKYEVIYLPDPVSWTDGPEDYKGLGKQRARWHLGTLETLWYHKRMFLNPRYGFFGLFSYPFFVWGEALEPLIELIGILYILSAWILGFLNVPFFILLSLVSIGFTFAYTITCLFIEELSFQKYSSFRSMSLFVLASLLENLGYRQFISAIRCFSFVQFFREFKRVIKVGRDVREMARTAPAKIQRSASLGKGEYR